MTAKDIIKAVRKIVGLSTCVLIAGVVSGAAPYQFSVISKDDRAVPFPVCGVTGTAEDTACDSLVEGGRSESFVVAPGLTVVSTDPG